MEQIKIKQSDIRAYQKKIVEIKEQISNIDLSITVSQIQKGEASTNAQIKKQELSKVPQGEQFQANRKQINIQIVNLQKAFYRADNKIKALLNKKKELNEDIISLEEQIDERKHDIIGFKLGADLTNALRTQIYQHVNNVKSFLESHPDPKDQLKKQAEYKKQMETLNIYQSDEKVLDQKLGQKQSEEDPKLHLFLFEARTKLNVSKGQLNQHKIKLQRNYQAFKLKRQSQQKKIGEYNKIVDELTKSKYHKTELYKQSFQKYQTNMALILQNDGQKTQKQLQYQKKQQLALHVLKQKQTYLSQMKILIQLQQLDVSILQANNFDLRKYKQLLAKKLESIKLIAQHPTQQALINPQFLQISKQISSITETLNTTNLLIPYKYPIQLLITTKQEMLQQHFDRLIEKTSQKLKQQYLRTNKLQQEKKQLKIELTTLTKELDQATAHFSAFTSQWENKIKEQIKQDRKDDEVAHEDRKQPTGVITNLQETIKKSRQFLDTSTNKKLVEEYQDIKNQSTKYRMQSLTVQQQYLNPLLLPSSLTRPKLPPKKNDKKTIQLQAQHDKLMRIARSIFEYKQKQGDLSSLRKSNIGLYSSIY